MARKGGKGSRARTKARRKAERRAKKDAMRAQYEKWAGTEANKKKKGQRRAGTKHLLNPRKGGRTRIPFPIHLWLDKNGNLKPGAPHRAYLEMVS